MKFSGKQLLTVAAIFAGAGLAVRPAPEPNSETTPPNAEVEFRPAIRGLSSNDLVVARQCGDALVLFDAKSKQALAKASTNGICFYQGQFFYASPSGGPEQAVYITRSQPLGTNEFGADQAQAFRTRTANDYSRFDSPFRKYISLRPILQSEYESVKSASGVRIRNAELIVEAGQLTVLFESQTGIKGKVILDNQLNPVSMAITSKPDAPKGP